MGPCKCHREGKVRHYKNCVYSMHNAPLKPKKSKKHKHLWEEGSVGKDGMILYCDCGKKQAFNETVYTKPKKSIKKKETKVQELERRIKALEAHRCNPTPPFYPNSVPTQPYGLQQNQPSRCRWCGLEVSLCRGHAIG